MLTNCLWWPPVCRHETEMTLYNIVSLTVRLRKQVEGRNTSLFHINKCICVEYAHSMFSLIAIPVAAYVLIIWLWCLAESPDSWIMHTECWYRNLLEGRDLFHLISSQWRKGLTVPAVFISIREDCLLQLSPPAKVFSTDTGRHWREHVSD